MRWFARCAIITCMSRRSKLDSLTARERAIETGTTDRGVISLDFEKVARAAGIDTSDWTDADYDDIFERVVAGLPAHNVRR